MNTNELVDDRKTPWYAELWEENAGVLIMKTFKGLSLEPLDALKNISAIIESGHLMVSCSDKECEETGDVVIDFARQYAAAAYAYALEENK